MTACWQTSRKHTTNQLI